MVAGQLKDADWEQDLHYVLFALPTFTSRDLQD
jgi:hypothetical protein